MARYKIIGDDEDQQIEDNPIQSISPSSRYKIKEIEQEPTSFLGAALRAGARVIPEAVRGGMDIFGLRGGDTSPLPDFIQKKPGDAEHPIAQFIGKNIGPGLIAKEFGAGAKLLSGLNRANNVRKLGQFGEEEAAAEQQADASSQQRKSLESMLQEKYGTSKPESLQRQANIAAEGAKELEPFANMEPYNASNRLPGATGEGFLEQAKRSVQNIKQKEIAPYLEQGIEHNVKFAERIANAGKDFKSNVSNRYENIKSNLENENVQLSNQRSANEIMKDLKKSISEGGLGSTEASQLAKELDTVGQNENVSAKDFFSAFRSNRQVASKIRSSSYGKDAQEFDRLQERADRLDDLADKQEKILEETPFGGKVLKELKFANQEWRQVKELEKNSLYNQIRSKGRVEGKILPKLAGSESGLSKLHEFLKNDPEAMKHLLGSEFAENPEAMLTASPRVKAYIESNPSLSGMRDRLMKAMEQVNKAEANKLNLAKESQRIEKSYAEQAKKESIRQAAIKDIQRLNKEVAEKEKAILDLKMSLMSEEMSLKEKINSSIKMAQVQKDRDALVKVIKGLSKVAITGIVGGAAIKVLSKIF